MTDTLTLDIETSARVGLFFGNTYKAKIAMVIQDSYVFGFSWKSLGKKVQSCYVWDYPLYKKDPRNDIEVVKKYIEVVNGNVVIGQNSRQFDDKVMMGRIIVHRLPRPFFQTVDTLADVRQVARYDSHKLDDVSKSYGFGGKDDTGGIKLWWECMNGDPKAMKKMVKYCERDVILTEKKYLWERPYYKRHPAYNVLLNRPDVCPVCGKNEGFRKCGSYTSKTNTYQVWECKANKCHPRSRVPDFKHKEQRMEFV